MRPPKEPNYSCPNLDAAIQEIEEARKIHDALRSWGKWWEERAEELEKEMSDALEAKDKEIAELEHKIELINEELRYAQQDKSHV